MMRSTKLTYLTDWPTSKLGPHRASPPAARFGHPPFSTPGHVQRLERAGADVTVERQQPRPPGPASRASRPGRAFMRASTCTSRAADPLPRLCPPPRLQRPLAAFPAVGWSVAATGFATRTANVSTSGNAAAIIIRRERARLAGAKRRPFLDAHSSSPTTRGAEWSGRSWRRMRCRRMIVLLPTKPRWAASLSPGRPPTL
jgi:hypothetical protein